MTNTITDKKQTYHNLKINLVDRLYIKLVFKQLNKLKIGCITIHFDRKTHKFGNVSSDDRAALTVYHPLFFKWVVYKGHLGFAEALAKGYCQTDNLTKLLVIFAKNFSIVDSAETGLSYFFNKCQYFYYQYFEQNSVKGSKQNISAHYDLGNNLFKTFLDKNMQYSSALYHSKSASLDEAQITKMQAVCERLRLNRDDHVLEIGSGWGGLAIFIAESIKCRVTSITISKEQFNYASHQVKQKKLDHLVNIQLLDYRDIKGKFDKVISIEMIEAVGEKYYQTYFNACNQLLKPGGSLLLQAILIADHKYDKAKTSVDFIKRYIFPGSNIPSLNRLNYSANIANFRLESYNDMTQDYVTTLAEWQSQFNKNIHTIKEQGYDDYFINIWNFYFSYCQAGFIVEHIRDAHLVFHKR